MKERVSRGKCDWVGKSREYKSNKTLGAREIRVTNNETHEKVGGKATRD